MVNIFKSSFVDIKFIILILSFLLLLLFCLCFFFFHFLPLIQIGPKLCVLVLRDVCHVLPGYFLQMFIYPMRSLELEERAAF